MRDNSIPKPILERRRCVRVAEALPFKIGHHGYELESVTVNIGLHGVMCLVAKDIPMMTQLNLCLSLPPQTESARVGRKMRLKGVVVRKERCEEPGKYCLAVFFSEIKPADLKTL
ncbi:MAG: PilZ domain-containing protein, partial [Candidatus Omnitrophota bacterium]